MHLKAICFPKNGPSIEFGVPTTGSNAELLRHIAMRGQRLDNGRKSLNAKQLLAEDHGADRLRILTCGKELGFDFQKVLFDSSQTASTGAVFVDERRERTLRIELGSSVQQTLMGLPTDSATCDRCHNNLQEPEVLKGDGVCKSCEVAGS